MIVAFAIETSCDETAISIMMDDKTVLAESVFSQDHREFGGVYPEYAARQHIVLLKPMIINLFEKYNLSWNDIDIIAVTVGPGLIGGLIIGLMIAKSLAMVLDKPLIAVNHLEGHLLASRITEDVEFPFLTLLISGGHTQILYSEGVGKHTKIGETLDDALGECFDKVAKMLGFGYPGGSIIEKHALLGDENSFSMPRPLIGKNNYDFSFSGLKTHIRNLISNLNDISENDKYNICASFQKCVVELLIDRLNNSFNYIRSKKILKRIVVSGGVAANLYIRNNIKNFFESKYNVQVFFPPIKLCTDNATMIAWAGIEKYLQGKKDNLCISPKSRLKL